MKPHVRLGIAWGALLTATVTFVPTAGADRAALVVGGELTNVEGNAVQSAAELAVEEAGWNVVKPELSPDDASELLVCISRNRPDRNRCLGGLYQRTKVERAVLLLATSTIYEGTRFRVLSGWVLRRSGRTLAFEQRFCEGCRADKLAGTARTLVGLLIRSARAEAAPSLLAIRSSPPGARIVLDDKVVGATNMEFRVYPGRHLVRIEKDGFAMATREVILDDGEHAAIEVTLERKDGAAPAHEPQREVPAPVARPERIDLSSAARAPAPRSRLVPWLLVGIGGTALATAGVLVALGGNEAFDGTGRRAPDHTETTPYAIGLGSAGAVALGIGVYLLVRPAADKDGPVPAVSVGGEAAWVGVRGAF